MKNNDDYRLELQQYANNFDNKRQDYSHTMTKGEDNESYKNMMALIGKTLLEENALYDDMGDDELKKYEKWLIDGEF